MNIRDKDVLLALSANGYFSQRELAEYLGCSLGGVNQSLQRLICDGYIDSGMKLTEKSRELLCQSAPKRALLLAAGAGMRMSPFKAETPKPLLEVGGETLIERIIKQLRDVGISEIHVVVGYAKEQFEYLIDQYGVGLTVNPEYARRNNLYSLMLAGDHLENSYIVPCDIRFEKNPFRREELYSWYAVSDEESMESSVRINRKGELAAVSVDFAGNRMIGVSYLTAEDSLWVREKLAVMSSDRRYEGSFWEEALYDGDKMRVYARLIRQEDFAEINTAEDLWELDFSKIMPIPEVASALGADISEITDIAVLKRGSTNRSFRLRCRGEQYILRIPYDGNNVLPDHGREAQVCRVLAGTGIADDTVYIDPANGVKLSKYVDSVRVCDPRDADDVKICMAHLRRFHGLRLEVGEELDLFDGIEYYESLWNGSPSVYRDYGETKKNVFSLKEYIDGQDREFCLTHIDAVPDNFLICDSGEVYLIDWEYAAMQDPHLDIAMFALYSMYDRAGVDSLIDAYFTEGCTDDIRLKIYCYISVGGLLWSNWCEYRQKNGSQFGEYSLRQYRYAKEYYRIVRDMLRKTEEDNNNV